MFGADAKLTDAEFRQVPEALRSAYASALREVADATDKCNVAAFEHGIIRLDDATRRIIEFVLLLRSGYATA